MSEKHEPKAESTVREGKGERLSSAAASGKGASAVAAFDHARAEGATTAAASFVTAIATSELPKDLRTAAEAMNHIPDAMRGPALASLQAALAELKAIQVDLGRVKETVDDVWASKAADQMKANPMVTVLAKNVLTAAAESGALTALATALLPK